jgi:hypothetical protein
MGRAIHLLVWRSSNRIAIILYDIQQHVNSTNSGDVDIRNLTVTLIRTIVLQRSWYQMPGCSVQCKMNKNAVILELPLSVRGVGRRTQPIRKPLNDLLITSALNPTCLLQSALNPTCLIQVNDFRTVVLQRSWYQMSGCSLQWKMNKNTHGYMTVWYTKGIYVSFIWVPGPLYLGKLLRKWCELGKDEKSYTFISLEVQ